MPFRGSGRSRDGELTTEGLEDAAQGWCGSPALVQLDDDRRLAGEGHPTNTRLPSEQPAKVTTGTSAATNGGLGDASIGVVVAVGRVFFEDRGAGLHTKPPAGRSFVLDVEAGDLEARWTTRNHVLWRLPLISGQGRTSF